MLTLIQEESTAWGSCWHNQPARTIDSNQQWLPPHTHCQSPQSWNPALTICWSIRMWSLRHARCLLALSEPHLTMSQCSWHYLNPISPSEIWSNPCPWHWPSPTSVGLPLCKSLHSLAHPIRGLATAQIGSGVGHGREGQQVWASHNPSHPQTRQWHPCKPAKKKAPSQRICAIPPQGHWKIHWRSSATGLRWKAECIHNGSHTRFQLFSESILFSIGHCFLVHRQHITMTMTMTMTTQILGLCKTRLMLPQGMPTNPRPSVSVSQPTLPDAKADQWSHADCGKLSPHAHMPKWSQL